MDDYVPFFPDQASTFAGQVDALFLTLLGLSSFFTLLIVGLIAYFGVKYRRKSQANRSGIVVGNTRMELAWMGGLLMLALPGLRPEVATVQHYGDSAGRITVYGNVPGRLVYYPAVTLSLASGEVVEVVDWSRADLGRRIYAMVTPLHYGSYGGLLLKIFYAVLGIGTCLLVVTGLKVWLSRPVPTAERRPRWTLRLMNPVVHGLPLATAASFFFSRLLPQPMMSDSGAVTALLLGLWALTVPWLMRPQPRAGVRAALLTSGFVGAALLVQ